MSLSTKIAKARLAYHANVVDLINAGNQLGIIKDEKAEELAKKHTMTIMGDILPRIYGQAIVDALFDD